MPRFDLPKPRIVYSACLSGELVRYDGQPVEDGFALKLKEHVEIIPVCPEVSIGLGVPREKIIVYTSDNERRLSQPRTGLELTDRMRKFTREFLNSLPEIDGFLLKGKSPSCGVSRTKTYYDPEGKRYRGLGKGLFALEVLKRFPDYPVEDELRLRKREIMLQFLLRIFILARLRETVKSVNDLKSFHEEYEVYLKVLSPGYEKKLRRSTNKEEYTELFRKVISKRLPSSMLKQLCAKTVPEGLLRSL